MGSELNILDYTGRIDLREGILERLDYTIASIHEPCYKCGTVAENTNAYLGAIKNPYVKIIGHPDDGRFPIDYDTVVAAAANTTRCWSLTAARCIRQACGSTQKKTTGSCWIYVNTIKHLSSLTATPHRG